MKPHFSNLAAIAVTALLASGCAVVGSQAKTSSVNRQARPVFNGQITFAGGDYEHDIEDSLDDETSAGFVGLLLEGNTRSGFGGGFSLEMMSSDDDLFEGQTATPAQVSTVEFAPYFLYRMVAGNRFRMPIRFGPWIHLLDFDDQGSSDELAWVSGGIRLALEPEVVLVESGAFECTLFTALSVAGGATRVHLETAGTDEDFDTGAGAFGFEIGPRFRWSHFFASVSFLHRGLAFDESDPENNVTVRGVDTTFDAIAITIGGRI